MVVPLRVESVVGDLASGSGEMLAEVAEAGHVLHNYTGIHHFQNSNKI